MLNAVTPVSAPALPVMPTAAADASGLVAPVELSASSVSDVANKIQN